MTAFGMAALVMAIYLWTSGNKGTEVGTFMTITLLGSAVISYFLTIHADRIGKRDRESFLLHERGLLVCLTPIGRRRVIMMGSCLMTVAGLIFFFTSNYYLLLFAAILGIVVPGAHEVGPFRALQVSQLSQMICIYNDVVFSPGS